MQPKEQSVVVPDAEQLPEQQALALMEQALRILTDAKDRRSSRRMSLAITDLETSVFWLQRDVSEKT